MMDSSSDSCSLERRTKRWSLRLLPRIDVVLKIAGILVVSVFGVIGNRKAFASYENYFVSAPIEELSKHGTTMNQTVQANLSTIQMMKETEEEKEIVATKSEDTTATIINVCFLSDRGVAIGRTFNKIIALGNAIEYAQRLADASDQPARAIVRIQPNWVTLWNEWFVPMNEYQEQPYPRVLPYAASTKTINATHCHVQHNAQVHFRRTLLGDTMRAQLVGKAKGLAYLRPLLQPKHFFAAQEVLDGYRLRQHLKLQNNGESKGTSTTLVATVHLRWLEGKCESWLTNHWCPLPPNHTDWLFVCHYTPDFCRQHLQTLQQQPQSLSMDTLQSSNNVNTTSMTTWNAIEVVLLGDSQRKDFEERYYPESRDNHSFPIQVAMMMLSDYHFSNPKSTVDIVVAHWRNNTQQFPESCYQGIWKRQKQQQQQFQWHPQQQ